MSTPHQSRRRHSLLLLSTLVLVTTALPLPVLGGEECPQVVRVLFDDPAVIRAVSSWVEPWEVHREAGYLVVGVDAEGLARLQAAGLRVQVDEELTARLCRPPSASKTEDGGILAFPCYRTIEETFQAAQDLVARRPDLASWIDIGDSWELLHPEAEREGHDLMVLRLTNAATSELDPKPALFATGGMHARELAPPELLLRFAERLVDGHGIDADITWILDEHEINLFLLSNPDGRERAEQLMMWRKNADNDYCPNTDDRGADINRNFEYEWGCCGGSSAGYCDETYRGPFPGSEPETQAVQDYLRALFPAQWNPEPPADATGIYLDIHAYGALVLWPWGFGYEHPPNSTALQTLGRKLAYYNHHVPYQSIFLYPTDGTTIDFAYGELGVAAFTFEVGDWFFEDCTVFEESILEPNLDALLYAAKVARTPYLTPSGPEVTEIVLDPGPTLAPDSLLTVVADVTDRRYSNVNGIEPTQTITAVEYAVDVPPWRAEAGQLVAMIPVDGSFDHDLEEAEATLDTTDLARGRHSLFLRAQDADGNWGATSAAFFWLGDRFAEPRQPSGRVAP